MPNASPLALLQRLFVRDPCDDLHQGGRLLSEPDGGIWLYACRLQASVAAGCARTEALGLVPVQITAHPSTLAAPAAACRRSPMHCMGGSVEQPAVFEAGTPWWRDG